MPGHSVIPLHWTVCHQWRQSRLKLWGSQRKRSRGSIWFTHWSYQTSDLLLLLLRKQPLGLFLQKKLPWKFCPTPCLWPDGTHPAEEASWRKQHRHSHSWDQGPCYNLLTSPGAVSWQQCHKPRAWSQSPGVHTTSSCMSQTEHGDLCWLTAFKENIYINSALSAFSVPLSTGCWFF